VRPSAARAGHFETIEQGIASLLGDGPTTMPSNRAPRVAVASDWRRSETHDVKWQDDRADPLLSGCDMRRPHRFVMS